MQTFNYVPSNEVFICATVLRIEWLFITGSLTLTNSASFMCGFFQQGKCESITFVKLLSCFDDLVAVGTASGRVAVFQLVSSLPGRNKQVNLCVWLNGEIQYGGSQQSIMGILCNREKQRILPDEVPVFYASYVKLRRAVILKHFFFITKGI